MVLVGNVSNTMAKLPLGLVILKSLQIIGSDSIESNELIQLFQLLNEKGIRPHVDCLLNLEDAQKGHEMLEKKMTKGRIVLDISHENWFVS